MIWADLDLNENDEPLKFEMYKSRVKGLYYQNDHLASISSSGDVTVWTLNIDEQDISELCTTNIGCRPTCLTMINLADFADDYVLKHEPGEEEHEVEEKTKVDSIKAVIIPKKNVGKVIIENDDSDIKVWRTFSEIVFVNVSVIFVYFRCRRNRPNNQHRRRPLRKALKPLKCLFRRQNGKVWSQHQFQPKKRNSTNVYLRTPVVSLKKTWSNPF